MAWRVGIDTGGTFTDLVGLNPASGELAVLKVHSTPDDPGEAVASGLLQLCSQVGINPNQIESVVHGSTVATNAVLEHKGAALAFITTQGFRDVLLIQRQDRLRLYDLTCRRATPLLPRNSIYEITERTRADGTIETPVEEDGLQLIAEQLRSTGVQAVAVGLLHSVINPTNERQIGAILQDLLPGVAVCLSHEITGSQGEYERFNTAAMNSYVQPTMQHYLDRLQEKFDRLHTRARLFIMKSNGGMTTPQLAGARSVETLLSGPAGGVIAGQRLVGNARPNLITADVGGTSFDVAVIRHREISYATHTTFNGLAVNLPIIDIHTVGAGGGSIGWVDAGNALRVGPHSAGADPGPACYGRGGNLPTVTDANLVLGRIARNSSLAGGMTLDLEAARQAIQVQLATPLAMSVEEAAEGMIRIINARMTAAMRKLTVERGYDPEEFSLCMFGGTGPLHGAELAEEMGLPEVVIPTMPGVFSAYGLLVAEMREEQIQAWLRLLDDSTETELERAFQTLADNAASRLRLPAQESAKVGTVRRLQLRYQGQSALMDIDLPPGTLSRSNIRHLFEELHEEQFSYAFPGEPIEIVNLWAIVTAPNPAVAPAIYRPPTSADPASSRPVFLDGQYRETPVYQRFTLAPGSALCGPAILEQSDTTTLLLPDQKGTMDEAGNLILRNRQYPQ